MGLASKLAAQAAAAPPAAGQQPYGAYPPPQQQPGFAPQQPGWGAPPQGFAAPYPAPAAPYQQQQQMPAPYPAFAQQQAFGQQQAPYPQQQQQQQPDPGMASVVGAKLASIVAANQLQAFYPPDRLQALTQRVASSVDFRALAARWRMPVELAIDLAGLALYDIVIYGDDSGSMESENGERIDDLKLIMGKVAEVATLFDDDGIEVRFINADVRGSGIKAAADASRLLAGLEYRWDTKLATQMEAKILQPMAYARAMNKPLLIITITDGEPSDKPQDKIVSTIMDARARLAPRYGPHAVAFQFAQVGKDREAQEFLSRLDKHPQVGKMIDCTSYYELESAEYTAKGLNLSVEAWLVKLMVGAIDPEYDEQDEAPGPAAPGPAAAWQGQQQPGGYYPSPGQAPPPGYPGAAGYYPPPQQQQQQQPYPPQQQQQQPYGQPYPPQQQHQQPYGQQPAYGHQQQQPHKPKKGFLGKLFG